MGKGSGSCHERPAFHMTGATGASVLLSTSSKLYFTIEQNVYDFVSKHRATPNPTNDMKYASAYAATLVKRYGKGNFSNTPTQTQFSELSGDIGYLHQIEQIVKETIQEWPTTLRTTAVKCADQIATLDADDTISASRREDMVGRYERDIQLCHTLADELDEYIAQHDELSL